MKILVVDPPSGWMYGFPKVLKDEVRYEQLLRDSDYPVEKIPLALKCSRYWEIDEEVGEWK